MIVLIPYLYDNSEAGMMCSLPVKGGLQTAGQIFSYVHADGWEIHVDIGKLKRLIGAKPEAYEFVEAELSASEVDYIRRNNGIEAAHLLRLSASRLAEPGLMQRNADGTCIVIDGNHRMVRRWTLGHKTMMMWALTPEQVRPALLDLPKALVPQELYTRKAAP